MSFVYWLFMYILRWKTNRLFPHLFCLVVIRCVEEFLSLQASWDDVAAGVNAPLSKIDATQWKTFLFNSTAQHRNASKTAVACQVKRIWAKQRKWEEKRWAAETAAANVVRRTRSLLSPNLKHQRAASMSPKNWWWATVLSLLSLPCSPVCACACVCVSVISGCLLPVGDEHPPTPTTII